MGSRKPFFDLNELPSEEDEGSNVVVSQPQKSPPDLSTGTSNLFPLQKVHEGIQNNRAFKHASSGSVFQPFVRNTNSQNVKDSSTEIDSLDASRASTSMVVSNTKAKVEQVEPATEDFKAGEKEEGEWSDAGGHSDSTGSTTSNKKETESSTVHEPNVSDEKMDSSFKSDCTMKDVNIPLENTHADASEASRDTAGHQQLKSKSGRASECSTQANFPVDDCDSVNKSKEVKGIEASYALKFANNPAKRQKVDEQKEAMLGKRRVRQTQFINVEDAKQAGSMKIVTPRRQSSFPTPIVTRTVKETPRGGSNNADRTFEKQSLLSSRDQKHSDMQGVEGGKHTDASDGHPDSNGNINIGSQSRSNKLNNDEPMSEGLPPLGTKQGARKQFDSQQHKNTQGILSRKSGSGGQNFSDQKSSFKRALSTSRTQPVNGTPYQDTTVERLIREVTSEKFWHQPEEAELQCVPERFESADEYVRVFEPLLFEECRAQLRSTYEELIESGSRDSYSTVRVKSVERKERGWYDVLALPVPECKWSFKEGDVAVLTSSLAGSAQAIRSGRRSTGSNEDVESNGASSRVVGTVRRYTPVDTRDPIGISLRFYVGDLDLSSKGDDSHILKKLYSDGTWNLFILGSITTSTREYVALNAFNQLSSQMQAAVLKPSPQHFPKYGEQPPAMPDCFTQNFVDHLHRSFNGPQLSAIQWAAMHTASGTGNYVAAGKRQDPWPFTLVQGPPGTGKTHTVWGMLNVIHLVQYQHYYAALLKKLSPESYKQAAVSSSNSEASETGTGSIDEVLKSMDQNLFRSLPKLCPKPRMLVCAPSNAATDELLARVLDRGFIDGEMKVYRPDVARVGIDTNSRAAQAVSVERRTENLLSKSRDEVIGWLHQLKGREQVLSLQIANYQRELNLAAAASMSQGSVGVDPDVLSARDQNRDILLQNLAAAVEGRDKVLVEMQRLLILERHFRPGSNISSEEARNSLEASFANEAEILFTTLSSSGRRLFSRLTHGFDMVVIDEAAQAGEIAMLPPLTLGTARCVLVGDPQQLPATVISKAAGTLMYSRSLFERLQLAGCPSVLLSVQYRMHPQIRDFPSRHFYQGRLTDSDSVANLPDEAYYKDSLLRPYLFYDVTHGRESHRGGSPSYQNIHEAQFCFGIYEYLQKFLKANGGKKVTVGLVTPYKLQLRYLRKEFEEVLNSEDGKDIYINTVDAFQGQERDIIIMSCVRASSTHGVGFVADVRRMNVALTRAKRALWVVGNANALTQSDDWAALISDAKSRNCFMDMDSIPKDFMRTAQVKNSNSSNKARPLRSGTAGSRPRHPGMRPEEEKLPNTSFSRNVSFRSLDDLDHAPRRQSSVLKRDM